MVNKTITAPRGFLASGLSCGIKKSRKPDLALLVCPTGAKAAAVFTTNKVVSAPVIVSRDHIKSTTISAVVVNSGNANACTGRLGINNAIKMCTHTAKHIEISPRSVLVASTGIIGRQLPMQTVTAGIEKAAGKLSASPKAGLDFAKAIMTTDTKVKQAVHKISLSGGAVTIAGTAKGAGMIAPNMATMLCFITTDAVIIKALLNKALKTAVDNSFNRLTVDCWQSTNDSAFILASRLAGNTPIVSQSRSYEKFLKALVSLCDDLVCQMALGAEGATRMFKVVVTGAATKSDARTAARAVANYPLVKCAVNGGDPNWGRIVCAVGSSGIKLNPVKLSCKLDAMTVFKNGAPAKFDAKKAEKIVSQTSHTITVDLGAGSAADFCYGCDLSKEYVRINAQYHT